jgi:hypothetical protein
MKLQLSPTQIEDLLVLYGREVDIEDEPYIADKEKKEFRKERKYVFTDEDKKKVALLRMICTSCQVLLSENEKLLIMEKIERGKNVKMMCDSCISKANKKYNDKHADRLKSERDELRVVVAKDKQSYVCKDCTFCKNSDKLIYHNKREREVSIGTITLKDYIANCKILCKNKLETKEIE